MACNEALLSTYLDGEMSTTDAASFEHHLETCADCRRAVQELKRLGTTLKSSLPIYAAPSHLRYRIQSNLDALKRRPKKTKALSWTWVNAGISGVCAVAFTITMALYLAIPTQAELINQEIVASHYRSLLANHLADVISSDHHTVKPWFTGKLDYAPIVNDFATDGFPLVGGRLDYINRRTVAALAYRHNSHLINVFMWPDTTTRSPSQTSVQGFNLVQWSEDGMTYSAVSDMNAQDLMNLRQLIMTHRS